MKRTCVHCGCERETNSARSQYVCSAKPCQNKARFRVGREGRGPRLRFQLQLQERIRAIKRKRGDPWPEAYDSR